MWIRYLIIGFMSFTSLTLFVYQGIEISQAFIDYFKNK